MDPTNDPALRSWVPAAPEPHRLAASGCRRASWASVRASAAVSTPPWRAHLTKSPYPLSRSIGC